MHNSHGQSMDDLEHIWKTYLLTPMNPNDSMLTFDPITHVEGPMLMAMLGFYGQATY